MKNLNVLGYSNFKVSYYWKAGSIKATYYTKLYYSTDGGESWDIYLADSKKVIDADYMRVGVDFSNKDQYAKKDYSIDIELAKLALLALVNCSLAAAN